MENKKTFYLTTTLPYVNAPLHIGHALEFVRADTIVRYKNLLGYEVFFNTGTDEHGVKIYEKALESGMTPNEFVDKSFETFKEQLKIFNLFPDVHYIRTTDKKHEEAVQKFWIKVRDNGFIYKKNYTAKYCIGCEDEKTESELVNGECPEHPGLPLKLIDEENYFFKYSAFADKLLEYYKKNPNFVVPEFRLNEVKNFINKGLQDFSISRLREKMPWGISVPEDDSQVIYVWFDALINYISTLGWPEDNETFKKYWIEGTPTQYCGKDNTRFQAAMWQAMLMAADLPNSHQIVIDGHITGEGGIRMSKSLGNVVDPRDIANEYGIDALRYFLLKEVSSFEDSPFTIERFKDSYNSGLVNGLGNLTSRLMRMSSSNNIIVDNLPTLKEVIEMETEDEYGIFKDLDNFDIKVSMDKIWTRFKMIDGKIEMNKPYKLLKSENLEERQTGENHLKENIIYLYYNILLLELFMPSTALKIKKLIEQNKMPEAPLFPRKD